MRHIAALLVFLASAGVLTQQPLKIVVLEGEGSVNIIQQKTAVRALVEVRDQNNLPVSGATVTFALTSKGGATVAGAQTMTVTTNAVGQAALSGATPLTSGGLQISVNATFNGLTATASISQSVVTTAAAAAGAAGGAAGAAGGAAGAGAAGGAAGAAGAAGAVGAAGAATGGLSIATVAGIVGGAVAVGGGVAAASGGDDSSSGGSGSTGAVDPTGGSGPAAPGLLPSCEFTVTPEDILVGNEGGTIGLTIVMKNVDPCYDPSWVIDVSSAASWISVNPRSGSRNGSAVLTIAPYVPTSSAPNRVATIIAAYERVLISQPCRCPMAAAPPPISFRLTPRPAAGSAARDDR